MSALVRRICGLQRHQSARNVAGGQALVQNIRRGHYELTTNVPARHQPRVAFGQLATAI